jgi:hypothetical protein
MRRSLFNLSAVLLLILCIGILVVAVRSRFISDRFEWVRNEKTSFRLVTESGIATIQIGEEWSDFGIPDGLYHSEAEIVGPAGTERFAFRHETLNSGFGGYDRFDVAFPLWLACVILAITPGLWLAKFRKRRRREVGGLCDQCGYDLRASSDRCPECGKPISIREQG